MIGRGHTPSTQPCHVGVQVPRVMTSLLATAVEDTAARADGCLASDGTCHDDVAVISPLSARRNFPGADEQSFPTHARSVVAPQRDLRVSYPPRSLPQQARVPVSLRRAQDARAARAPPRPAPPRCRVVGLPNLRNRILELQTWSGAGAWYAASCPPRPAAHVPATRRPRGFATRRPRAARGSRRALPRAATDDPINPCPVAV